MVIRMKSSLQYGTATQPLNEFIRSIRLVRDEILMLDQTLLPIEEETLVIRDYRQCIEAIKMLRIRGAPAIGVAAGAAAWLAAMEFEGKGDYLELMHKALDEIEASRPTAVNLFKATQAIRKIIQGNDAGRILEFTENLIDYEIEACKNMGIHGAEEIKGEKLGILTHCNTGSLATVGIGTALGVIRTIAQDRPVHVFVDETRPLLQGARLTTWELMQSGIPCTLITDNMAASVIATGAVDCVITGADRIAANGDSANKIGTYGLSILAKHHDIPLYIVAPESTIDRDTPTGEQIDIEERKPEEVVGFREVRTAPNGCKVYNPAFDVTPAENIAAIITNTGIWHPGS